MSGSNSLKAPLIIQKQNSPELNKKHIVSENNEQNNDTDETIIGSESDWKTDYADRYDFCIIFPADYTTGDFTDKGKGYIRILKKLGFEIFAFKGMRPDKEIFVLVRAPIDRLRQYAEQVKFKIKLNRFKLKEKLESGDQEKNISPIVIPHNKEVTKLDPYEYIYGRYCTEIDETIYYQESGITHPFREVIRLKLDAMILESKPGTGQNLKIQRYLRVGTLLGCYPLHNRAKTQALGAMWRQFPRQKLPLYHIKEYFGEKIAMYFAFTQHFLLFLLTPAIIGLPMQVYIFATSDYSATFLPFFSLFISLWAVCMLEFWKRKEKGIALEWGTIDFETDEVDRPDFKGEKIPSFVDGSEIRYFSSKKRSSYICQSITIVTVLIIIVIGIVVGIYIIRFSITPSVGVGNAQTIASLANAIQIQILNHIYSFIANALSERENHRTETQFEDSMITKIFMFQFINSYASFFYLAFIAETVNDCPDKGCMSILAINLAIIFGTRMIAGNIFQLLIPYLSYQYKYKKELENANGKMTRPEKEYLLSQYNQSSVSLEDYADIAITYGYMAMFVTALPGAALAAWLSLSLEVQVDGWKLLNLHQRPFPKGIYIYM